MKKQIHFIGIGGIGVSALATYYLKKGWGVSGCDLARSEITDQLKKRGARVRTGTPEKTNCLERVHNFHDRKNDVPSFDEIVYSPAVPINHPERKVAQKRGIKQYSYPEALGQLTKEHFTIAVSGTHGKSTTTAMLGLLLTKAGLDPTVIVGTKLKEFDNSNCRVGKSKYLVIEADEHFASFLNYRPQIIVLTTLEADHLDFYKTFSNLKKTFRQYVGLLPKDGVVVANKDDKNLRAALRGAHNIFPAAAGKMLCWFSLKQPEAKKLKRVLAIPGKHNISNALAALTVARILKIPDAKSFKALAAYKGSWRRFEVFNVKSQKSKVKYTLVSDYGHHPTEIKVTLQAAREKWVQKTIWLLYQPHQYQRTFYLFLDFVKVLSQIPVQKLLLLDIYDVAGREEGSIKKKISSAKLVEKIQKKHPRFPVLHIPTATEAKAYLAKNLKGGEIVIVMGAGDIYQNLTLQLTQEL